MHKEGLTKNIYKSADEKTKASNPPFFTLNENGKQGMLRRQCTSDYKVQPVTTKVKRLIGVKKWGRVGKDLRVRTWMGISYDEIQRMRESRDPWQELYYPLIERKLTRKDCLTWMKDNGYPMPPRSACTYCPYHSDQEWLRMKTEDPQSFQEAVEVDKKIRNGIGKVYSKLFLHKSCKPLDEIQFDKSERVNQEFHNFQDACEGMCGV